MDKMSSLSYPSSPSTPSRITKYSSPRRIVPQGPHFKMRLTLLLPILFKAIIAFPTRDNTPPDNSALLISSKTHVRWDNCFEPSACNRCCVENCTRHDDNKWRECQDYCDNIACRRPPPKPPVEIEEDSGIVFATITTTVVEALKCDTGSSKGCFDCCLLSCARYSPNPKDCPDLCDKSCRKRESGFVANQLVINIDL